MGGNFMRILILDDEQCRHNEFAITYSTQDITHTTTYKEFIHELSTSSPWDLIHLDHDLGESTLNDAYVDGWGVMRFFNGQHASLRICELSEDKLPCEVIVHSINPEGAKSMVMNLTRRNIKVTWRPYSTASSIK